MSDFPLISIAESARGGGPAHERAAEVATPIKLNLFLEVIRRRDDGFHDLETLFLALDHGDRMAVVENREARDSDRLTVTGHEAPTDATNLVRRAADLARTRRSIPFLEIELEKRVPAGTGLGAGSANAAGMLALLHRWFPDPRGVEGVRDDAAALGSDVAFFLGESAAAIGRGRGEQLESIAPGRLFGGDAPGFVIVLPSVHSSTAEAYREVSLALTSQSGPITFPTRTFESSGEWQRGLFNRLEARVIASVPQLAELARRLQITSESDHPSSTDWVPAQMTGSGSAFFVVGRDFAHARTIDAALCARGGPLDTYERQTGVAVSTLCARPHPRLFPS